MFERFGRAALRSIAPWRASPYRGARGTCHGLAGGGADRAPLPAIAHNDGDLEDGVWPDDLDTEPAWVVRRLARSAARGIVVPQIRSRRELDAATERCRVALLGFGNDLQPQTISVETVLPEHTGVEAAKLFLAHLRDTATVSGPQQFSSDELAARYAAWCAADQRRAPTPENVMRGELKALAGVARDQVSHKIDGRRVRPYVWTVYPVNLCETGVASGERRTTVSETVTGKVAA